MRTLERQTILIDSEARRGLRELSDRLCGPTRA